MTDGNTSSAFVLQGSMNPSIYSFAHHHAFAAPATGAGAGAGIYRPNSSSLLGGYRAPRPAAATPAAEGGNGGNDDSFEGLTLRVAAAEPDGGGGTEQALPALLKPLLRVSARTVSVDKIQRFIHKRMLAQAEAAAGGGGGIVPPEDIEILRDGVSLQATAVIGGGGGPSVGADGVILLHYRRRPGADVDTAREEGHNMEVVADT
jgi:hypothetical protein